MIFLGGTGDLKMTEITESQSFPVPKWRPLGPPGEIILKQEKPLVERFGPILLPPARQENSISNTFLRHLLDFQFHLAISGSLIL